MDDELAKSNDWVARLYRRYLRHPTWEQEVGLIASKASFSAFFFTLPCLPACLPFFCPSSSLIFGRVRGGGSEVPGTYGMSSGLARLGWIILLEAAGFRFSLSS